MAWLCPGLITLTAHTGTDKPKVMQHLAAFVSAPSITRHSLQPKLRIPLLQKLTVVPLTKKCIVFYETLWFIAVCTTVHNRDILLPWRWRLYCHWKRQSLCVQRHSLTTRKNYVESLTTPFWIIVAKYCFLLWIFWFHSCVFQVVQRLHASCVLHSTSSSASMSALLCPPFSVYKCWSRNVFDSSKNELSEQDRILRRENALNFRESPHI
jgi:hypothetical protein